MANVVTDEKPAETVEAPNAPNIREAILQHIPDDPNIQRDIRIHDGIADISIKWRTLRWSIGMGMGDMTPAQIGQLAAEGFRGWLLSTLNNINQTPRHARVLDEMGHWLNGQKDGVWADVERYRTTDGAYRYRVGEVEPASNVTEFA